MSSAPDRMPHLSTGDPDELTPRRLRKQFMRLAIVVWAVAVVVILGPGLDRLRDQLLTASPTPLLIAAGLEVLSVLSYVVIFRAVFCPQTSWRVSYRIGAAEQAANTLLPAGGAGGLALGAWALRRGGFSLEHISRRTVAFFLLTSAANVGLLIAFAVMFELGILQGDTAPALTYGFAAAAAAACIVTIALPKLVARARRHASGNAEPGRLRALARGGRDAIGGGVEDALLLLRQRSVGVLVGSLGWLTFDVAVLVASFAAFGHPPRLGVIVVAYLIGQLGGLLPVPGGIGGVEGGLIGTLVLYDVPLTTASAGVLAYRGLALWIPALLGSVAFIRLRKDLQRTPDPPPRLRGDPPTRPTGACGQGLRVPKSAGRQRLSARGPASSFRSQTSKARETSASPKRVSSSGQGPPRTR